MYTLKKQITIYFVHFLCILNWNWLTVLIKGVPGTSGDVYLEGICGGIISNLGVWLYFYFKYVKAKGSFERQCWKWYVFKENITHSIE